MSGTVAAVTNCIPARCHAKRCDKDRCKVDLKGIPTTHLLVDMDCDALKIPRRQKRCDYLFVGEGRNTTWIAPIELKSGRLSAAEVLDQLEGGVRALEPCIPQGVSFQLVPVLARGKAIHPYELRKLRSKTIQLRGRKRATVVIKCGDPLTKALAR